MRLPAERFITVKFLQQILTKKKNYFTQVDAPTRELPNWAEFSISHMLKQGYVDKNVIDEYFPDDPLNADRSFFWAVWLQCKPTQAEEYI